MRATLLAYSLAATLAGKRHALGSDGRGSTLTIGFSKDFGAHENISQNYVELEIVTHSLVLFLAGETGGGYECWQYPCAAVCSRRRSISEAAAPRLAPNYSAHRSLALKDGWVWTLLSPVGVPHDLPNVAVWILEVACVSTPKGIARSFNDMRASAFSELHNCIDF